MERTLGGWARGGWDEARFAVRGLVRNPTFSLFAAGTLALGVGSSTTVFSALEGVVLNPLPFAGADRMVTVWRSTAGGRGFLAPHLAQAQAWREMKDVFEDLHAYRAGGATLTGLGDPVQVRHFRADEGLFGFLGYEPILGRTFTHDEHAGQGARVAVISEGLWKRRFGARRDVLGTALTLNGEPWTVVGVVPEIPDPTAAILPVQVWSPLGTGAAVTNISTVGRLEEGVTTAEADARLEAYAEGAASAAGDDPSEWAARAMLVAEFGRDGIAATLRSLMAAAVILLLIACVNVANLLLHRAVRVRRETAVRAALGASRGRLLRQALGESLLLGLAGCAAGTGLAWISLRAIEALRPTQMRMLDGLTLNATVLGFALGASVAAGLLFGALPALRLARRDWAAGVGGASWAGRDGSDGRRARWAFVAAEIGLSFALVVGAGVVVGSLRDIQARDPGFRAAGLLSVSVSLPSWRYQEAAGREAAFGSMLDKVRRLPGVQTAVLGSALPPNLGALFGRLQVEGQPADEESAFIRAGQYGPGILHLLGQPLLAGRDLESGDAEDGTNPIIVGQTLATRLFPGASPEEVVGRRFRTSPDEEFQTIVGVAGDIRTYLPATERDAVAYFPRAATYNQMTLALRLAPGAAAPDPATLRSLIREVEPDALVETSTASRMLAETAGRERFTTALLSAFTLLALALSAVGLYGVLSQAVGERTREIGIRMSLGADASKIRGMVLRGGAAATLTGLVVGVVVVLVGMRVAASWLAGLTGIDETGWTSWLTAALVVSGVSLLATWVPARRAIRTDPARAMRGRVSGPNGPRARHRCRSSSGT